MRLFPVLLLLVPFASCAILAEAAVSDSSISAVLAWTHKCDDSGKHCLLQKLVDFRRGKGTESGGIRVAYDTVSRTPQFIEILVPPGLDIKSEVLIAFVDTVMKDGKWTFVPVKDSIFSLPLSNCDESFCIARVHPKIPNGPNLFEEFQHHNLAWILFMRAGKPLRFLVPLSGLTAQLVSLK